MVWLWNGCCVTVLARSLPSSVSRPSMTIEGGGVRALVEELQSPSYDISKRLTFGAVQVLDDSC